MNAKTITSAVLVVSCWVAAAAHAQDTPAPGIQPPPIKPDAVSPESLPPPSGAIPVGITSSPSQLSDWITFRRPECCSPGPLHAIYAEAYLRVGPSQPVGGNYLERELLTGWSIEGGFRGLLFNTAMTRAWVLDIGIVNTNNSGIANGDPVTLDIILKNAAGNPVRVNQAVTVRNYNRTSVSVGGGQEWYLWEPADSSESKWRIGYDAGGRYGSAKMSLNEIRHRTDTIAGLYAALHTDFEIPCGHCFLSWGARVEWAYTWGDILQRQCDVQDVSFFLTFSVRY